MNRPDDPTPIPKSDERLADVPRSKKLPEDPNNTNSDLPTFDPALDIDRWRSNSKEKRGPSDGETLEGEAKDE